VSEIRISPGVQLLMLLALITGLGLLVSSQSPEIKRYMKIRSM
jgi:hypothetical protein